MENSNRLIEEFKENWKKARIVGGKDYMFNDENFPRSLLRWLSSYLEKVRQETLKVKEKELNEALQQQRMEKKQIYFALMIEILAILAGVYAIIT